MTDLDKMARKKAEIILNDTKVSKQIEGKPYMLFSIKNHWYMIVIQNGELIKELYVTLKPSDEVVLAMSKDLKKPTKELIGGFDKNKYHKDFITLNSDFYKDGYEISNGNPTYFFFADKEGNKYGESKLTALIKPNPIDSELYTYLLTSTLKNISD
ncbi:hypothetical protein [Seonamhaeicola marinus]|uniref:Uncharacterized protein n=1 Tax=Seonamhaeicola marinus TaxID=1912246 RepID=A0A5D0HUF8_9FLAO|nr:hypothetical protein [Seonamhaeicola marinus]TYA74955.1 hypothetical protein FUA24_16785 [Seonamhaeicola marinus]